MGKQLIPIFKSMVGQEVFNAVDARELHAKMKVGKDFSTWIKDRIEQCSFVQGVDFVKFPKIGESKSKLLVEYHFTLDAAKHLAMLERNEVGFLIRQYFIEFEKTAREILPEKTLEHAGGGCIPGLGY